MKKRELIFLIGFVLTVFLCSLTAFAKGSSDLAGEVLRLHVLANSDSEEDQAAKIYVKDRLVETYSDLYRECESLEEAAAKAEENLPAMRKTAEQALSDLGRSDNVRVSVEEYGFHTREYTTFALPAGTYTAVRVELGEAKGQNWWCVMFPPLCNSAAIDKQDVKDFSEESKDVLEAEPTYDVRFAIVDFFVSLFGG